MSIKKTSFLQRHVKDAVLRQGISAGIKAQIPMTLAMATWALMTGCAMVKSGMSVWLCVLMSALVYAGSSQMAALPLIIAGVSPLMIILTSFIVNLRFVIFNAVLSQHFRHLPLFKRLWTGYITTDATPALVSQYLDRYQKDYLRPAPNSAILGFIYGQTLTGYVAWHSFSLLGILLARYIPDQLGLTFGVNIALLMLVIPLIKNVPTLLACLGASFLAIQWNYLPNRIGLPLSIVCGAAIGVLVAWLFRRLFANKEAK
jgi:predicted branched-subunit amino acid permease